MCQIHISYKIPTIYDHVRWHWLFLKTFLLSDTNAGIKRSMGPGPWLGPALVKSHDRNQDLVHMISGNGSTTRTRNGSTTRTRNGTGTSMICNNCLYFKHSITLTLSFLWGIAKLAMQFCGNKYTIVHDLTFHVKYF